MPRERRDYLLNHALLASTALEVRLNATSLLSDWSTTAPIRRLEDNTYIRFPFKTEVQKAPLYART
jgi:hypothetical protein